MTTLKVEINEEKDLPILAKVLTDLGFAFRLESDEWENLPDDAVSGIKAGLRDLEVGNVYTQNEAKSRINKKLAELHNRHGR